MTQRKHGLAIGLLHFAAGVHGSDNPSQVRWPAACPPTKTTPIFAFPATWQLLRRLAQNTPTVKNHSVSGLLRKPTQMEDNGATGPLVLRGEMVPLPLFPSQCNLRYQGVELGPLDFYFSFNTASRATLRVSGQ